MWLHNFASDIDVVGISNPKPKHNNLFSMELPLGTLFLSENPLPWSQTPLENPFKTIKVAKSNNKRMWPRPQKVAKEKHDQGHKK